MDLDALRQQLMDDGLDLDELDADPVVQFHRWFDLAVGAGVHEPEAVILSTVDAVGLPSSRHVLCKHIDDRGFVIYTNERSQKGRELAANPVAALCFPWNILARQVRVCGPVTRASDAEADAYFATRPRGSQIGAWASRQSEPITGRAELEGWVAEQTAVFEGRDVPRPPYWGGFRIRPDAVEFWQGRPSRLHDRFRYEWSGDVWSVQRLSP